MSDSTTEPKAARSQGDDIVAVEQVISWVFLVGFLLVVGVARGVYSSQGLSPSTRFEALSEIGSLTFLWYWVKRQCAPCRAWFPMDLGLFIALVGFLLVPYYLVRYQGRAGVWKIGLVLLALGTAHVISIVVHYLLA